MRQASTFFLASICAACAAQPSRTATQAPPSAPAALVEQATEASQETVETPPAVPTDPEPATALEIPSQCADDSSPCTPPRDFSTALCQKSSPDLALAMFRKTTPWTRAYVRQPTDAWYTGGRHTAHSRMEPGEEVIIVAKRGANGGVQVGGGSYNVFRWDGKCVSLMADEVSLDKPRGVTVAPIRWRHLGERLRERLLESRGIAVPLKLVRTRCHDDGAAPSCTEAKSVLSQSIANYVRSGGEIPPPEL